MLITKNDKELLNSLFIRLKLKNETQKLSKDKECKIAQIIAYLEIIHAQIKKYSKKREIIFIDSCSGNSYLSFLVNYYFSRINSRPLKIHCIDTNKNLMQKGKTIAQMLNFKNMFFHTSDILEFNYDKKIDLVYTLHACDSATDKTIFFGLKNNSRCILSVSCCQHNNLKKYKNTRYRSISQHSIFKEKLTYMAAESMRALLLELRGYHTDIFEFVSSRYTDKNIILRAKKSNQKDSNTLLNEYQKLKNEFNFAPHLENYLNIKTTK